MLFKIVASKGKKVVFDKRVNAANPRAAREAFRKQCGLKTLSGVVYAITEIPVDLIRSIVRAEMKALGTPPAQLARDVMEQRQHTCTLSTATEKNLRAFYKTQRKGHAPARALAATAERFNTSLIKVRKVVKAKT